MNEKHICCICGEEFIGFGNNPYPIKEEGRCCDMCNMKVIEKRLEDLKNKDNDYDEMSEERATSITNNLKDMLQDLEESEILSITVMILEYYTKKYNKDFSSTLSLIRKGYKKYLELLESSDSNV